MLIYAAESYAIKGACIRVYKALGNGFLESVYQECLEIEFAGSGIPFVAQHPLALTYQGHTLRQTYKPDFVCYGKIIVELKAVAKLMPEHQAQVINYLRMADLQLGLLFNFGHHPLLEQIRLVKSKDNLP